MNAIMSRGPALGQTARPSGHARVTAIRAGAARFARTGSTLDLKQVGTVGPRVPICSQRRYNSRGAMIVTANAADGSQVRILRAHMVFKLSHSLMLAVGLVESWELCVTVPTRPDGGSLICLGETVQ